MGVKLKSPPTLWTGKGTQIATIPLPGQGFVQIVMAYEEHVLYALLEPAEVRRLASNLLACLGEAPPS